MNKTVPLSRLKVHSGEVKDPENMPLKLRDPKTLPPQFIRSHLTTAHMPLMQIELKRCTHQGIPPFNSSSSTLTLGPQNGRELHDIPSWS
ncbi:hypothetical protein NPIL_23871 [Nephila pilipes]|uniref:Uncharacterized protein n=1 Tax=Nephila pilipes TaxID=299642 RepID=A0A8X6Q7V6_NEPPI|nr:hypothetical protein NPIL_23871 [Nephila pilipes]